MPLLSKDSRKDGNIITVNGYSSKWGEWWHCWILKGEQHEHKTPNDICLLKCWWRREMLKKKILSPHHQMFTLKYVNRILRRICHANRLLDKCLLEPSMMEVIRSVLRRVWGSNPSFLSDFKSWMNCTNTITNQMLFHLF